MVDVSPPSNVGKYSPRSSDLVDAVSEAKRIADQTMRSNPMENAVVTEGLTRFVGNYGGDFAWFGEFFPADLNMTDEFGQQSPQRGISFVRDDPGHASAFTMYDGSPEAGQPLMQTITLSDGTGQRMMQEAFNQKGRRFPDKAIPMYARISVDNGGNAAAQELAWAGEGNLIGTHMHFSGGWALGGGAATISNFMRYSGGGVTVQTPTITVAPNHITDISSIWAVSDYVNAEWWVWRSAGTALYYPRPSLCRNFTDN
jgi:hypothetical protein